MANVQTRDISTENNVSDSIYIHNEIEAWALHFIYYCIYTPR